MTATAASVSEKLRTALRSMPPETPIVMDEYGAARVGSSCVLLEMVLLSCKRGETPERIVEKYPTLELADVCAVAAYYLGDPEPLDEFLREMDALSETAKSETDAANAGKSPSKDELRARLEASAYPTLLHSFA